ncbi:unnamed protein product [Psylliodes chrysocephalus]|uniref:EGF-like domain-containing protein n=1 Tax=Psylliodes chrysocephalus TaxID=3402493 RepID=A0A9P0G8F1_9CUCU|nr:unnamed protein product [Psylliodes chrysocephala]
MNLKSLVLLKILTLVYLHQCYSAVAGDPCIPSPCGPYGQCKTINGRPSCSCLVGCRPECRINADCADNKYSEPCSGLCGFNTECRVVNHTLICSCNSGYTGNPYIECWAI